MLLRALLTKGIFRMSCQAMLKSLSNATSSPGWPHGHMRFVAPDGQTIDLFGQVPVLANLSARQAKELRLLTSGTYGPPGSTSSRSESLQRSLESRLQARLSMIGSTLYTLTWKAWVTPSGVSRSRLRASVRRTSETGTIGWPRDEARDYRSESATDEFNERRFSHSRGKPLSAMALLSGWATPNCPRKNDSDNTAGKWYPSKKQKDLDYQALLAASGDTSNGSLVQTASSGQLNPAHSRWLMGYPAEWDDCAPTATRSTRTKRQSSLPPS